MILEGGSRILQGNSDVINIVVRFSQSLSSSTFPPVPGLLLFCTAATNEDEAQFDFNINLSLILEFCTERHVEITEFKITSQ